MNTRLAARPRRAWIEWKVCFNPLLAPNRAWLRRPALAIACKSPAGQTLPASPGSRNRAAGRSGPLSQLCYTAPATRFSRPHARAKLGATSKQKGARPVPQSPTKTHAIRVEKTGGPEQMKWTEIDLAAPGKGEVQLKHLAVGLNYIDTYHRTGLYPVPLPSGLGLEASAVVEAVGEGVTSMKAGDRVAYGTGKMGA